MILMGDHKRLKKKKKIGKYFEKGTNERDVPKQYLSQQITVECQEP